MGIAVLYLAFSVTFFGVTAILAQREINARKDFKMTPLAGSLNVYFYYKHQKEKRENLSTNFKWFLFAHLNFALCAVVFFYAMLSSW